MAAHIRQQIRDALMVGLTGLVTTGAHVFPNRLQILDETELPALLVMNDGDQVVSRSQYSQAATHTRMEQHTISYKVRAVAKTNNALENVLDQICKEVEIAIYRDVFMGGLTDDARLVNTQYLLDESGSQPIGIAEMIWEFDTWVTNNAPDTRV